MSAAKSAISSGVGISGRRTKTGSETIARVAALEDKRFDAKQIIEKQTSAQLLSLWHSNNKPAAAKARIRSQKHVSDELAATNQELKLLRRARLKQLYDDEFAAQQNEMNGMYHHRISSPHIISGHRHTATPLTSHTGISPTANSDVYVCVLCCCSARAGSSDRGLNPRPLSLIKR